MCDEGVDGVGPGFLEQFCGAGDGVGGVGQVVDEDGGAVGDVADEEEVGVLAVVGLGWSSFLLIQYK